MFKKWITRLAWAVGVSTVIVVGLLGCSGKEGGIDEVAGSATTATEDSEDPATDVRMATGELDDVEVPTPSADEFATFDGVVDEAVEDGATEFRVTEEAAAFRAEAILDADLEGTDYVSGRVVVTLAQDADDDDLDRIVAETGYPLESVVSDGLITGSRIVLLDVSSEEDIRVAMSAILRDTAVLSCSPDYYMTVDSESTTTSAAAAAWDDASVESSLPGCCTIPEDLTAGAA